MAYALASHVTARDALGHALVLGWRDRDRVRDRYTPENHDSVDRLMAFATLAPMKDVLEAYMWGLHSR